LSKAAMFDRFVRNTVVRCNEAKWYPSK